MRNLVQRDNASFLGSRMCATCCTKAREHGLCGFCWGLAGTDACRGREDFRQRARDAQTNVLLSSSSMESVFEL
jgi:hypothetical protein